MISWSRLIRGSLAGKLAGLRHGRSPSHVRSCADCQAALRRERQYLERLRAASIPAASNDLTTRLLQQSHRLAVEPGVAHRNEAKTSIRPAPAMVILGSSASGVVIAAAVLAVAAYAVAGEPTSLSGTGDEGRLGPASTSAGLVARGGADAPDATGQLLPQAGIPTATIPAQLTQAQLAELRKAGWACPELGASGFRLNVARSVEQGGVMAVELSLSKGEHQATVVEEHSKDGAVQLGAERLIVVQGTPWRAVYASPAGTITFTTDLPGEQADDALPEIRLAGESLRSQTPGPPEESLPDRLRRGLKTIAGLAGF